MLRALVIILALSPIFAALLASAFYWVLLATKGASPWPFSRIYDRAILACFLAGVWILRSKFEIRKMRAAFQTKLPWSGLRLLLSGFAISFVISAASLPLFVDGDPLGWSTQLLGMEILRKVAFMAVGAVLISVVEEGVFRLLLIDSIRPRMGLLGAIVISNLLYAVVHFVTPVKQFIPEPPLALAGFHYLGAVFSNLAVIDVAQGLVGLFLAGLTLSFVRLQSGSLLPAIGMHAGWIMALKIGGYATVVTRPEAFSSGIGRRYFMVAEPMGWAVILAAAAVALVLWRSGRRSLQP